jgi:hypothetical protein
MKMSKEKLWPRVFCKIQKRNINPTLGEWQEQEHFTTMWLELPFEVSHSGDPFSIPTYVAEEFRYTFMPTGSMVSCFTQDHVDDLLNEVAK